MTLQELGIEAKIAAEIASEVERAGHTMTVFGRQITIDGRDASLWVRVEEEQRRRRPWEPKPPTKYRVSVTGADYRRTSFPQRKDGSHDYAKIAAALIGRVQRECRSEVAAVIRDRNTATLSELRQELGISDSFTCPVRLEPTSTTDFPVEVSLRVDKRMTFEQVREFVEKVRKAGLLPAPASP